MNKKQFFKDKLRKINYSIWDLEFKVKKTRQIREGIRLDRDRVIEALNKVDALLKSTSDEEQKKKLEEEFKVLTDNKNRYEAQVQMLDNEINGVPATKENPGIQGLIETIGGLKELQIMVKDHIREL